MSLPDAITTSAAAMFGAAIFKRADVVSKTAAPTGNKVEDYGNTEVKDDSGDFDDPNAGAENPVAPRDTVNTIPAEKGQSWGVASHQQQEAFKKAAGFLKSYIGKNLASIDKDEAAMALAKACKDTEVSKLNPNYGEMVSIYVSVVESIVG